MNQQLMNQVRQLSLEEQLELVGAVWDGIIERNAIPGLTKTQRTELERRLAEHESNPDDAIPWHEVKASALASLRQ